jgi:signal transduction histidine kinase
MSRPEDRQPLRAALDRLARRPGPQRRGRPAAELQCVGRDVTDRTETERALAEARDQAEYGEPRQVALSRHGERMKSGRRLNGIIGMSGLLLDTPLTPEQATYVKAVKTSGDALLSLIEELLDFPRSKPARSISNIGRSRSSGMIEDIAELLAPRAQARKIEIAAYVDDRAAAWKRSATPRGCGRCCSISPATPSSSRPRAASR